MAKKNAANVVGVKTKTTWKQALKRLAVVSAVIVSVDHGNCIQLRSIPGTTDGLHELQAGEGYAGSEWVGMKTFIKIFKDADFMRALRNSVVFNLADLLVGFPMPIILALILNELRYPRFKRYPRRSCICRTFFPGPSSEA